MDIKLIKLPVDTKSGSTNKICNERKERVIAKKENWIMENEEFSQSNQEYVLKYENNNKFYKKMVSQIKNKINGYKSQDKIKNKYNENEFIDFDEAMRLIIDNNFICYYCKQKVMVLYNHVREPKQWSLDRIDNSFGHNKNNLFLTCLECNLRRKDMYHERYVFTKQLEIKKI